NSWLSQNNDFTRRLFPLDTCHLPVGLLKRFNARKLPAAIRGSEFRPTRNWRNPCMKASRILMRLAAAVIFFECSVLAQDTASITGTVRDSSGAVVTGAEVKIVNSSIGVTRAATTNADGAYLAPGLPAGTYDLSVTAKGFKSYQAKGVVIQVAEKARVDVTLQIGQVNETVLVAGENVAQVET